MQFIWLNTVDEMLYNPVYPDSDQIFVKFSVIGWFLCITIGIYKKNVKHKLSLVWE